MENSGSNKNILIFVVIAAVVLVGVLIFSSSSRQNNVTETVNVASMTQPIIETDTEEMTVEEENSVDAENKIIMEAPEGSEVMSDARVIEVEGGSFYYKPNEIRVKAGEKVKVTLNSVDLMHDFVIDELNVRTPVIKEGETASVEFIVDEPGEYEFYCSVGQHRANGMFGKLIVE
ncbi:hypothetical protein C4561_01095 [candidate division WWE3 bacterium]|jgi:plastocyanin|uniref:EfeO-type cupredoxin-like domain-containing protein n=1 Tax=candidate division WWE3 bacterium TaxID=2053526 RepID=A0A3A4ZLV3_UNCKA|nr:MAG: hypothetical protein C4561_01095 [candidate division WWE3 bacterium]